MAKYKTIKEKKNSSLTQKIMKFNVRVMILFGLPFPIILKSRIARNEAKELEYLSYLYQIIP